MTATEPVDPTNAVGRLLPEGWRVERTYGYDGGTMLRFDGPGMYRVKRVPHGETVDCIIETPLYGLTIHQPYASLIAHGIKTIETRGFQPRVVKPGDDLAIIAGAKRPKDGLRLGSWDVHRSGSGLSYLREPAARTTYGAVGLTELRLPLGAVVAVARFVEALPMVDGTAPFVKGQQPRDCAIALYRTEADIISYHPDDDEAPGWQRHFDRRGRLHPLDDQLPYGDYRPGRFGWLLDNIRRLPEPIPCTGFQGLRALPADVDAATRQAVQ